MRFPTQARDVRKTMHDFYQRAGFPGVVGAIGCTHVRLYGAPLSDGEYVFVNRKGYHGLNVQMVSNASYEITNIVARWPGSSHDSAILHGSVIGEMFENRRLNGVLLGATGYALRPWLMTPFTNPETHGQRRFNNSHKRTRVIVEQMFGQLKRRFPCLVVGLRVNPVRANKIILACAVLHNMAKSFGEPEIENEEPIEEVDVDVLAYVGPVNDGRIYMNHLVNMHFTHV